MNNKKAPFITLEGIDGSGKSSQINTIKKHLEKKGYEVALSHEPGGTEVADKIRTIFKEENIESTTELLLAFASRNEHLKTKILPLLEKNVAVVCDRFTDTTYAYQGGGRQLGKDKVEILENLVQEGLKPDAVFYFKIDFETSKNRLEKRSSEQEQDRLDLETEIFFEESIQAYEEREKDPKNNYIVIDATQDIDYVEQQVLSKLDNFINNWEKKPDKNKKKKP